MSKRRKGSPVEEPRTIPKGRDYQYLHRHQNKMSKTQLVKRLRLSLYDWQNKRSRLGDKRTTAKESTIALLKKARKVRMQTKSDRVTDPEIVDPITREHINFNKNDVFVFRRGSTATRVDASALIDYILATGDYLDPESRVPFDEETLARLDHIGTRLGKSSILEARKDLQSKLKERQFVRDAICGLERLCGEHVTQMFELVEKVHDDSLSIDEAQLLLLTEILPEFKNAFDQLVKADEIYARQSAKQFDAFLRGPPNKPVETTEIQLLMMALFSETVTDVMGH